MSRSGNFAGAPTLPRHVLKVARAIAATMFDDGKNPPSNARLDLFVADVADFARHVGVKTRIALRAGMLALQWSPVWVIGRPLPFTMLSREDKLRFLAKAEHTAMPLVVQGMKAVFCIVWFELNEDQLPAIERREPRAGAAYAETFRETQSRRSGT